MATAKATTDHDQIRKWVEARGGHPARVKATGRGKDPGILRIDFPGFSGEDTLEEIEWDEFFEWFERDKLAILLSSERRNRFNKLVKRGRSSGRAGGRSGGRKAAASSKKSSSGKKSSTKKASVSTKKASVSTKKASTSRTKASTSKAKASTSKTKASTSKAKASTSRTKASNSRPKASASTKKASSSRKRTTSKKTTSKKSSTSSKTTTNHDEIRRWVEARGGFPATVIGTEGRGEEAGLLRIDYPGYSGKDTLERIDWDDWFEKFDAEKLTFLYQNKRNSRFSKLVRR